MMNGQTWIVVAFALITAGPWVVAQAGGGNSGGGNSGGGNSGGGNSGGGTNSVRRVQPNNGYTKGVANYALNTITIGGRTITPRIMIQDFSKRGARILLRSKRWGGVAYPYLAIGGGNSGGGGNAGGGTSAPPTGGGGSW